MSPSDKNKSTGNSSSGEGQSQLCSESCEMNFQAESTPPSTSNVTLSGHGSIVNIPWVTASQSTIKCSVNDQMKTFDPGEGGGVERLTSTNSGSSVFLGKSCSSSIKNSNNKNYKAGSKINKLADMLAKRSQNVVEVKENTTDIRVDITSAPKLNEETVVLKSVSSDLKSVNGSCLENTTIGNEVKLFRKSRRKSVPNQSYSLHNWQSQSTSKSCSDIFELFPVDENDKKTELNALKGSMSKLETDDESTKQEVVRTNSKSANLPFDAPDKNRTSPCRSITLSSSIIDENVVDNKNIEKPPEESSSKVVEKPADKHVEIVEKPKGKLTEKSSSPLESVMKNAKEKIIDKPVDILVDKPKDKPAEKSIGKATEEEKRVGNFVKILDEHSVDKIKAPNDPKEKSRQNSTDKPVDQSQEKSRAKSKEFVETTTEKSKHKPVEHSVEKSFEKSKEKSVNKLKEKLTDNYVEKYEGTYMENTTGKPVEKHVVKSQKIDSHIEKASDKSAENLVEKSAEKSKDKTKEKLFESHTGKTTEKCTQKLRDKSVEKAKDKTKESHTEKAEEKHKESLNEKVIKKPKENVNEKPTQKSTGNLLEKSTRKSTENLNEKPTRSTESPNEKPSRKSTESMNVIPIEKPTEKLRKKSTDKLTEKPTRKSSENLSEKLTRKSTESLNDESTIKSKEKSTDGHTEKVEEKSSENLIEKPKEKTKEKFVEKAKKKLSGNQTESKERKENRSEDQIEDTKEQLIENSKESLTKMPKEKSQEKVAESSKKRTKEDATEEKEKLLESPKEKHKERTIEKQIEHSTEGSEEETEKESEKTSEKRKITPEKTRKRTREVSIDDNSLSWTESVRRTRDRSCKKVHSSARSPRHSDSFYKLKEIKKKQRKSKRLVESSTQTADIEFISVIKPSSVGNDLSAVGQITGLENFKNKKSTAVETDKPERVRERVKIVTYECLYCTQTFTVWALCKAHEKTHAPRKYKQFRCQYCSKKLFSLEEFKNHCIQKHRNKYAYCKKCDFRFSAKEELYSHNKEIHLKRSGERPKIVYEKQSTLMQKIVAVQNVPESVKVVIKPPEKVVEKESVAGKSGNTVGGEIMKTFSKVILLKPVCQLKIIHKNPGEAPVEGVSKGVIVEKAPEDEAMPELSEEAPDHDFSDGNDGDHFSEEEESQQIYEDKQVRNVSGEGVIKTIPSESVIKRVADEKVVKNVPVVETVVKKISEESVIKRVSDEQVSINVSDDKMVKNVRDENVIKKVADEKVILKVPDAQVIKRISEEKVIKKIPDDQVIKSVSEEKMSEMNLEEKMVKSVSEENVIKKIPDDQVVKRVSEGNVIKKIPDDQVIKRLSGEDVIKKVADDQVIKRLSGENVIKKVSDNQVVKRVSEGNVIKRVSGENVIKKVADDQVIKKIPDESVVKKVPTEEVIKKVSDETVVKNIPDDQVIKKVTDEKVIKKIPDETVVKKVADEKVIKKIPDESVVKKVPTEEVIKKVSDETVVKKVPNEEVIKKVSDEIMVKKVSEEKVIKNIPDDQVIKKVSEENVIKKIPDEKVVKRFSGEKIIKKVADDQVIKKFPDETVVKKVLNQEVVEKVSDEKVIKQVADEKVIKKIPDETVVKMISEKKVVKKVSEEKEVKKVSEEKVVKKISGDNVNRKAADEKLIKKIPGEKEVKKNSDEKVIRKIPDEKVTKKIPEENVTKKIPEEKVTQKVPEEKVTKKIPEEKVTKKVPEEKVTKKIPEEKVTQKVPEEKVTKKIPEEKVTKKVPEEKVTKKTPEEKVTKKIPEEKVLKKIPEEKVTKKIPEEKVTKKVPEEKVTKKTPEEKVTQKVPEEKVTKKIPEEKVTKKVPEEKVTKKVPEEKVTKKIPEEKVTKKVSEEKVTKKIPEEKVTKKVPEEKVNKKVHEEKVTKKIPEEKVTKKVSEEKVTKKFPEEKMNKRVHEEKVTKKVSEEKVTKKFPEEKVNKKVHEEKVTKRVSGEKVMKKGSDEKVTKKTSEEKVVKKVSDDKVIKKVSDEKLEKRTLDERAEKKTQKSSPKTDLRIDVSFDTNKKSSVSPRSSQRCSPKEKTEEQILEMEMLFYSHLSGNIQENLTNHLDGKIDQNGTPVRIVEVPESTKNNSLLSVASPSSGTPDVQVLRAPSPYQTRSKTPNPLPPTAKKFKKLPNWQQKFWEKYNFPTNYRYQHRFWDKNYLNTEKPAFYLKDLSCLDIKTQLTMRNNIKKLDEVKKIEENTKPADTLKFPEYLSLVPKPNKVNNQDNRSESQKNSLECAKAKKQIGKEDTKKSFKSPGTELPASKSRSSKTNSEVTSDSKKQSSEGLKMMTRRQSSLESTKDDREDSWKKRKGSLDSSGVQRMALRRQTSLDNIGSNVPKVEVTDQGSDQVINNLDLDNSPLSPTGSTEISGEWVRPRSYLCGTCCTKFTNLWELEDHKWVSHPNVWCTHYEFEDEKIDKLFQKNEGDGSGESSEMSKSKLTDLYKRYLLPHGYLKTAKLVPKTNFPEECTKCKKNCMNSSELHKHMLDCGGDTTWFLTMYSSPMTIKRKWRPFGSRRKKQIGRRDVKRNIPSTPTLRSYHYQHRIRTKPGDVETIQKMLANLPEKRARRAINFDEIKTRSQATIHSNRLLRKRFKSTFSNNFLKLKNIKQKRQLKQGKKESGSKSTTDTSSENTPVGSPKRRNKFKESLQLLKEENSRDGSSENSEDAIKIQKKKVQKKRECPENLSQTKTKIVKMEKPKLKKEISDSSQEKPMTRSNNIVLPQENKTKKKTSIIKEEVLDQVEISVDSPVVEKQSKSTKKTKKTKMVECITEKRTENVTSEINDKEPPMKVSKKIKVESEVSSESKSSSKSSPHWINARCNPILRLKQNSKAKSELLKSIKKKVKNSRKILEKKEAEEAEGGSRRSLRIKSLHQVESDTESQSVESSKKVESVVLEKDLKIKTVVVSLENALPIKTISKYPKSVNIKTEKESPEDTTRRRSLRNSVSFEDKQESQKSSESHVIHFNPRSILRRNLRNERNDSDGSEIVSPKATSVIQRNPNGRNSGEHKSNSPQVSLLKKNNIQNSKVVRGGTKPEEIATVRKFEAKKSFDLEEMPILAKVEPIRGKIYGKTEKEIPVLMPVEREQKRGLHDDEEVEEDSIILQVMKKRRKNSKEITPLKIVKTVDSNSESGSGVGSSFRIENSESLDPSDTMKSNKRKKFSEVPPSKTTEKKAKTDVKKYFLGIDPNEIDKGRCDGQDESGSDNEPLICLMNNQPSQNRKEEVIVKKEDLLDGEPENQVPKVERRTTNELPVLQSEKEVDKNICDTQPVSQIFRETFKLKKKMVKKKKKTVTTPTKELRVTVTLKEPILKIIKKPGTLPSEGKWTSECPEPKKNEVTPNALAEVKESVLPERRSRRISKETKSTSEFVIDDPLILVDELWSDLDSDSDSSKKKSKKGKKKSPKKKTNEEKKMSDVNLEELLRNFGENKEVKKTERPSVIKVVRKKKLASVVLQNRRKAAENRKEKESYRRLSLKLFRFNKSHKNFGNNGVKLSHAKKALREKLDKSKSSNALPDLPFLAAEIKENPVQVIQCGVQKPKTKRGLKKVDVRNQNNDIHLKISLPLDAINNLPVFNNNHLTEPVLEEPKSNSPAREKIPERTKTEKEDVTATEPPSTKELVEDEVIASNDDANDMKNKSKRSDVIDKIFYCEICQTYYYSSSQLKIHKLSNRHKLKESELQQSQEALAQGETCQDVKITTAEESKETDPPVQDILPEPSKIKTLEEERINDDTLEMPTLEGPFIEGPLTRLPPEPPVQGPSPPPPSASFGFTQESLKDIQKAIGCTDEEMLILTLLGENTIEIENDILDLDSCKSFTSKPSESTREKNESGVKENDKANGAFKVDLKQRMTSALACLVNKAVFNLLQKYENVAKTAVNPEALSLLGKLSNLSRRKNVLQLNELLKKRNDGESSVNVPAKDIEKKEPAVSYKYQCTICGNRFEKASTRECHISRSHRGKAKKHGEDLQTTQVEDEWNDSWSYDDGDDHLESTTSPQFWCSDCGINFLSPQEVLDHQKVEHQTGIKDGDQNKDSGPLQSSTIGSSDEIIEGKKSRRRPKLFSTEELHQQRIIANNELRKLDRRFSNKNKSSKTKWGMDALKFTVEKENKAIVDEEEKEVVAEESIKPPIEVKNIDLVPKLNLSRISNIPEFKVIQKNSFENRFQKIIDNKLKRKCACPSQEENVPDDVEEEVMLVPVVVKKKKKKQKVTKCSSKKEETGKPLDVYDFNESESEGEPAVYSHIKKPVPSPVKIKLVKEKEGPSKNKADSTTKDLAPDDYDSEDSLPLSVVKKSKPGDEDEEKDEKVSEDGVEKSDGILEQVEYLIEQLENETGSLKNENITQGSEFEQESETRQADKSEFLKEDYSESLRVSVANKFLEIDEILPKSDDKNIDKKPELEVEEERVEELREQESVLAEPESSQSTFDEEDSIPLVLISKKTEKTKFSQEVKKCDENTTDVSTTASEDVSLLRTEENKSNDTRDFPVNATTEESLPPVFSSSENDGAFSEKSVKTFETLNGNVIYCRNDSMTDFESDLSNDGLIDSNYEKNNSVDRNYIKEVTEKEDVVIVCSKGVDEESNESKISRDLEATEQGKDAEQMEILSKKRKRFPLLSATIEENNFRRSESPKSNKEVIVRKIWNRKKLTEDSTDNDEDSYLSMDNSTSVENLQEEESRTEIEKEIIVKKIWSRKKPELEEEFPEKIEENFEDIKINQTEVSDEVVIKCGPKAKPSPKRRKSKSSNEASKETIMRKIWSGKCTFQTKAALKTYESDVLPNCKENESLNGQNKSKKRRRPSNFSATKRTKAEGEKDDEDDDLESLLEEIEREQLEKAIRSEFLQLRRSEKGNVEMKESGAPTVGIFTETTLNPRKEVPEKKRRKIKKKLKIPKQSLLKRKKIIRKPFRRVLPSEERNIREEHSENSLENKNVELFRGEGKMKNRKHKKHRHKHHHHKHKHKKSKHHKSALGKHKSKHEFGEKDSILEKTDSFTILEKICQEIPSQIESESQRSSKKRSSSESNDTDSKLGTEVCPLENKGGSEVAEEIDFGEGLPAKRHFESINIYEFVEDVSDFSSDGLRSGKK